MNKGTLIGIGLIAFGLTGIGAVVGAVVMNEINNKCQEQRVNYWKVTAEFLKDQLTTEWEKNDKLSKRYWDEISRKEKEEA